jgi:hypothetical protein
MDREVFPTRSAREHGAVGSGGSITAGGSQDFCRQPQLRDQADVVLCDDRTLLAGEVRRLQAADPARGEDEVRALLGARLTISELWRGLRALGIRVRRSSVGRFLARLGPTQKIPCAQSSNNRRGPPARPSGKRRRASLSNGSRSSTRRGSQPT